MMGSEIEIAKYCYRDLVEALRLISSSYEVQAKSLPSFVHLPDEILNAFDVHALGTLHEYGLIDTRQVAVLQAFDTHLDRIELPSDYDDILVEMKSGAQFSVLRAEARRILEVLGEEFREPTIDATYVKGL